MNISNRAVIELSVHNFPPTVKTAWTEVYPSTTEKDIKKVPIIDAGNSLLNEQPNLAREQAIKVARYVCIFGIFPAMFVIFIFSTVNINRPHGSAMAILVNYGIIIPLIIIVYNEKIRQYALDFLRRQN